MTIIGIDNMNDYYDVSIKEYRLQKIEECVAQHSDSTWHFIKGNIADKATIDDCFAKYQPDIVEGILRVMNKAPEKVTGEDGLRKFAEWYKEFYL